VKGRGRKRDESLEMSSRGWEGKGEVETRPPIV